MSDANCMFIIGNIYIAAGLVLFGVGAAGLAASIAIGTGMAISVLAFAVRHGVKRVPHGQ